MMTRQQISVKIGLTYNLGDYSNIRPEVQISGEIADDAYIGGSIEFLQNAAMHACYRQIDEHLERLGQPAEFSDDPRFSAHLFPNEQLVLIMPDHIFSQYRQTYKLGNYDYLEGYRLEPLRALIARRHPECAVEVFTELPPPDRVRQLKDRYESKKSAKQPEPDVLDDDDDDEDDDE